MLRWLPTLVLMTSTSAFAWPVDWIHDVEAGREKFVRLPKVDWFEVDDPKVVSVEWLESGELLLTGLKAGRAMVLLGADGRVAAWRVRVSTKPVTDERALPAAQKACADLNLTPLEDVKLTVTVRDEACRKALTALFQTDAFEARHLALTFEGRVLQAQLSALQEGLKPIASRVTARFVGAGLVLEGPIASEQERRRVMWEVLRRSLGRFALDDRLVAPEVDAGRPAP